ncbi:MAG: CTP synthase [Candidatus Dojkabacteria bacterium]
MATKYIFISGGVISGIGKGVTSSSIGILLQSRGYKVSVIKCETYLNVDSGTINPIEHGDPFLCADGLESDMDLGTYERFLGIEVGRKNFVTMGQIYLDIINRERSMGFGGKTVDAIPTIPNELISRIKAAGEGSDICLVELGGTAGEYQNIYNYEAARMMKLENYEDCVHVHLSYVPIPEHLGEPKTKPTQLSIRFMNMAGIQPDFLVLRCNEKIDALRLSKVAVQCNIKPESVIMNANLKSIYELPLSFEQQNFDQKLLKLLGLKSKKINLTKWNKLVKVIKTERKNRVKIGIISKYIATGNFQLPDSYNSLAHALKHSSWATGIGVDIAFINAEGLEHEENVNELMKGLDGIIVPIGWGSRGVEGKIRAIKYARENKVPYLGLCYGMQLAAVEFARSILGWKDAHTEEVDPKTKHNVIYSIPFDAKYQTIKGEGTSMRLGTYPCVLKEGTLAYDIFNKHMDLKRSKGTVTVYERHRHRFEFNNKFRKDLEKAGMVFSGTSPDDFFVEMLELPKKLHPFFIATQAHPEYKSKPLEPHPMFVEFLKAADKEKKAKSL